MRVLLGLLKISRRLGGVRKRKLCCLWSGVKDQNGFQDSETHEMIEDARILTPGIFNLPRLCSLTPRGPLNPTQVHF